MLSNKNALILLWTGNEIPDNVVVAIKNILIENKITTRELLEIIYKDQEEIASCLVKKADGKNTITFDVEDETAYALEQAIIYIGKRFEGSLASASKGNILPFALLLQKAVSDAHNAIGFNILSDEGDKALLTAVELIATTNASIPTSLAKKYHITNRVLFAIKQVYNQFA